MNLDDYEKEYLSTYQAFAKTVRFILEKALLSAANLPRPQSVQCRAKGVDSHRRRLTDAGEQETHKLERINLRRLWVFSPGDYRQAGDHRQRSIIKGTLASSCHTTPCQSC